MMLLRPDCACVHDDARQCFLTRHPECRRYSDDTHPSNQYEQAIDETCDCFCHQPDEDDYFETLGDLVQ